MEIVICDTVFRLTRLYAECEDYKRSIFNDVLLKLQLETIMDVTGTLHQLCDHMYAKTSIVKHISDSTGDLSEEDKDHKVVDLALDSTHEDEEDESIDLAHDSTYEDEEDEDEDDDGVVV
jgi:hypothetical protein